MFGLIMSMFFVVLYTSIIIGHLFSYSIDDMLGGLF